MAKPQGFDKPQPVTDAEQRRQRRRQRIKRAATVGGLVGAAAAVLALGVYFTWLYTPLDLPATAEEGAANIGTARFKQMPEYRQDEYVRRTFELSRDLPREQRRAMFENIDRDEMRDMFERGMVDMARRLAKGEEPAMPFGRPRGERPPRPENNDSANGDNAGSDRGPRGEGAGDGQRRDGERRGRWGNPERMQAHMRERIQNGNAQVGGLMGEMFRKRREQREERDRPNRG